MSEEQKPLKYIVYIRRSQDRRDAQSMSLESQKHVLDSVIKKHGLKVVSFLSESASAYKKGRPVFGKMIKMIENGKADAILVYHLSRLSRNGADSGLLVDLFDQGHLKEIRTPESVFTEKSNDKFMIGIHFAMNKKSSDDTSQYVSRDMKEKIEKGEYPGPAPVGYLNMDKYGKISGCSHTNEKQLLIDEICVKEMRSKLRVEKDPILASAIKDIFELAATGRFSLEELAAKANAMGLRGVRNGEYIGKTTLVRVLKNPFFYGAIRWKHVVTEPEDMPEDRRHQPIITRELFERVQEVMSTNTRPRPIKYEHRYRGLFKCAECGCSITSEVQKGTIYYRCTKKAQDERGNKIKCSQPYIPESQLEEQMWNQVSQYVIPDDFAKVALEILADSYEEEEKCRKDTLKRLRAEKTKFEDQMSGLLKLKISPSNIDGRLLSDDEFLASKLDIQNEKNVIERRLHEIETGAARWLEQCEEFFDFATSCDKRWQKDQGDDRKLIFSIIFGSNSHLDQKTLKVEAQKPFFQTAFLSSSEMLQYENASEKMETLSWRCIQNEVRTFFDENPE